MGTEEFKLNPSEKRLITAVIFYFLKYNMIPSTVKLAKVLGHSRHFVTELAHQLADKGYIHRPPRSTGGLRLPGGGRKEGTFRLTDLGEEAYRRCTDGYEAEVKKHGWDSRPADME